MKNKKNIQTLDRDWIELIIQAKSLDLTKEEIRKFLYEMGSLEMNK